MKRARTSRQRYQEFVRDYRQKRLDDIADADGLLLPEGEKPQALPAPPKKVDPVRKAKRRQYVREYLRWLRPHRYIFAGVFVLALMVAGLQMIEPLFMRYIVDKVLLNTSLDSTTRLTRLNVAGAAFVGVILLSKLINVLKDYRQRLLNVKVMLSLRRSLYDRLLHLPLPKLWEMKTGGILSRLTGDIETTTGFLQMAIVSPALSVIRLVI